MYNGKLIAHVAFWIGCGSFAAYTTVLQFVRYYRNADTPKISYIELHHSTKEDVYPDITICFEGLYDPWKKKRGNVHNNPYLQKYYSLSKSQYNDLLIGNKKAWNEIPNATRVADINFDEASLTLDSTSYRVCLPNGLSNITKEQLIQKSFQIPGLICFTRSFGSYFEGSSIVREEFRNVNMKPKPMRAFAFVHYPGRMLRKIFGKDRRHGADLAVTLAMLKYSSFFKVKLSLMSVLKKRPDAVEPCDPTPTDDKRFWEELFSRIPCLPAYWKEFNNPNNSTLKDIKCFTMFFHIWVENVGPNTSIMFLSIFNRHNMTQLTINSHFKEEGANSLIANGALREKLQAGELNQEEVAFFLAFTNGKKRFEDPDNPFLRTEDGQNINEGDSHLLMSGDREGSPEPEDNYEDDEIR